MQQTAADRPAKCSGAVGEQYEQRRGWQRKPHPGRKGSGVARAHQPYGEADLAACWPWQKLAKRDQVGVAGLAEPAARTTNSSRK